MESGKFDRLARLLASAPSRRSVLRGVVGAAFGAGALAVATPEADAAKVVGRCERNKDSQCGKNEKCRDRECICEDGFRACREDGKLKCVDRKTDVKNCGRCGRRCGGRDTCVDGRCEKGEACGGLGANCNEVDCCEGFRCSKAGNYYYRACIPA